MKETITIQKGFSIWLSHVSAYKAVDTFKYYSAKSKYLLKYFDIKNMNNFIDINHNIIDDLINHLKLMKLSNNTINKIMITLSVCTNFLIDKDYIAIKSFKIPKLIESKPKIKIIEKDILDMILNYLEYQKNNQMKLVFMLMLTTGIRRTEITRIKVNDIDLANNQIYLEQTKNNDPRYIYILNDQVKELILDNINFSDQTYLLKDKNNHSQLSTSTIDTYFSKIKKDLKLETLSPHKLRHTYATMLINNGADMNSVRLLLGHRTLYMTQRYIQMNNTQLKNINNKFNPIKK